MIDRRVGRWTLLALGLLGSGCGSDEVHCEGIGALKTDSGVCDCPAGTDWVPAHAACEATSSASATDAGTKDGGLHLADAGIDAGDAAASDAARVDAAQVATGSDGAVVDAAADLADAATAADAGAAADASTAADTGSVVVDAGPPPPPVCVPVAEDCDGKDDDCDGVIDNGVKNACGACGPLAHAPGETCTNGGQGLCAKGGTYVCMGETTICNAPPPSPGTEVCDGIDNDCDGSVDEGFTKNACGGCDPLAAAKGSPCSAGVGECAASGVYSCVGTDATACTAVAKAPTPEACDSKDNDCDGTVDEDGGRFWYRDCDGDGYSVAAAASLGRLSCASPPPENGCGWTQQPPSSVAATDCDDQRSSRHPTATFGVSDDWDTASALDASDLNCDGRSEASSTALALWPGGTGDPGKILVSCSRSGGACPCLQGFELSDSELICWYGYSATVRPADASGGCLPATSTTVFTMCR